MPVLQEVLADAPAAQADDEDIDVEAPMKSADVPQGQEKYEEISPPLDRCSGDDCKCQEGMTGLQPFCSPVDPAPAEADDADIDVENPMKSADDSHVPQGRAIAEADDEDIDEDDDYAAGEEDDDEAGDEDDDYAAGE